QLRPHLVYRERLELGRHARECLVDDCIRHRLLHRAGSTRKVVARKGSEQPSIEEVTAVGEGLDLRDRLAKLDELRVERPEASSQEAIGMDERPVAIARNRTVHLVALLAEAREAPLVRAAVGVADPEVDQPRTQELFRIHPVSARLLEVVQNVFRILDLRGPGEPRRVIGAFVRLQLNLAQHARERLPELAQSRVVRHDIQRGLQVQDAGRLQQARHDDMTGGMETADLILDQATQEGAVQLARQSLLRKLVDRAEAPADAARVYHVQRNTLVAASLSLRLESTGEGAQVENRNRDRREPQRTPAITQPEPGEATRLVGRSWNHCALL